MKHLYDKEDILTYKTDEIPLGTTVIIKTKWDTHKGKLTLNSKDCIAIDYPKNLKGTYIGRDGIESIRVLNNFFDFYKKDDNRFFNPSNIKSLNYKDLDGKTLKMTVVDNEECLLVAGIDKTSNMIYMLHSEVK